jgi:hypothetical protein
VRHGRVYGDHLISGCYGSCGVQKVFEPASGVLDLWQTVILICGAAVGRSNVPEVRSQQVEFSCNISTDLQADPIGIVRRQVFGELQDRSRSLSVVFVLGVAAPNESDASAPEGAVTCLSR